MSAYIFFVCVIAGEESSSPNVLLILPPFLNFFALAYYTQFDTHRRAEDFASFCGATKIICLNLKATQVLAKFAVGTHGRTGLGLRVAFDKYRSVHTGLYVQVYTLNAMIEQIKKLKIIFGGKGQ